MNILGITPSNPDKTNLLATFAVEVIIVSVILSLTVFGLLSLMLGALIVGYSIGWALSDAYGLSFKKNGWRGGFMSTSISLFFMVLSFILIQVFK